MSLPKFNLPERQIPIRVRLNDEARGDVERIRSMLVPGRAGLVPLENIATRVLRRGSAEHCAL